MKQDIETGARYVCAHCNQIVTEVQDPYSFKLDYGANGDFGCDDHPLSSGVGVYGHVPDVSRGMVDTDTVEILT